MSDQTTREEGWGHLIARSGVHLYTRISDRLNALNIAPRFSNRRRALQLARYSLTNGIRVFEKLNRTNLFLAKHFSAVTIHCNVCGESGNVWYEMHSIRQSREHKVGLLRETLECLNCLSRMRYRIMADALLKECQESFDIYETTIQGLVPRIANVSILDTDAFSPAARLLSRNLSYKLSSYLPDLPPGPVNGQDLYNVDLQKMPFADGQFDIILSSDVMEHVRDTAQAHREIYRCLKPGGAHIFTVPFDENALATVRLIDTQTPNDIYLDKPQIHGDDHFSGGIPAYRIYGMDLIDELKQSGFDAKLVKINSAETGIFNGIYFIARRRRLEV